MTNNSSSFENDIGSIFNRFRYKPPSIFTNLSSISIPVNVLVPKIILQESIDVALTIPLSNEMLNNRLYHVIQNIEKYGI